jgi:hypothetical protein
MAKDKPTQRSKKGRSGSASAPRQLTELPEWTDGGGGWRVLLYEAHSVMVRRVSKNKIEVVIDNGAPQPSNVAGDDIRAAQRSLEGLIRGLAKKDK